MIKKFVYDKAGALASMKARAKIRADEEWFKKAIAKAQRGETSDLEDYLLSDVDLSGQELAALIRQHIQNKKRGRPRRSRSPASRDILIRWVVNDVRSMKLRWRARHRRKQLPKGLQEQMLQQVCNTFGEKEIFTEHDVACDERFLTDVRARLNHKGH